MKTLFLYACLLLAVSAFGCGEQRGSTRSERQDERYTSPPSADFQLFYDELSPYGTWVDYPRYGYVWMPDAGPDFEPYASDGRWVFTEDGWTWVSDYRWGWAPFHYGRWDFDPMYGWFWVPDNEWGPAWVVWSRAPGYYGWAPLPPGVSMTIVLRGNYHPRYERWIFVRDVDIVRPDLGRYYVDRRNNITIINNTTVIVNTHRDNRRNAVYIAGPDRGEIERTTRTRLNPVVIREDSRPGHRLRGNELDIYRPQIRGREGAAGQAAPARVRKLNEIPPPAQTNERTRQRETAPPVVQPGTGTQQPQPQPTPPVRQRDVNPPPGQQPQTTPPAGDTRRRERRQREETPSTREQQPAPPSQQPSVTPDEKQKEKELKKAAPRKRTRTEQQPPADSRKKREERERRRHDER